MTRRIVLVGATAGYHSKPIGSSDAHRRRRSWLSPEPPRDTEIDDRFYSGRQGPSRLLLPSRSVLQATIVNIGSGQPDQKKVIEFCASSVLPKLGMRS